MNLHLPTLLLCSALATAMAAGMMAVFAGSQRVYRGYGLWVGAQVLAAAGLVVHLGAESPNPSPLVQLLLLQWPVMVLAGLRRFHQRRVAPWPAAFDWVLAGALYLLWLTCWVSRAPAAWQTAASAFTAAALLGHAAVFIRRLDLRGRRSAFQPLGLALTAAALLQGWRLVHALAGDASAQTAQDLLVAASGMAAMATLVLAYVALLATSQRTHRDLVHAQRQLRQLANIDPLTQVPNRRHFHELAAHVLDDRSSAGAALLMFDIDHFKSINDRDGHQAGDAALRLVGAALRASSRLGDIAGRLGGDEFAVLLPATSPVSAVAAAERIVRSLSAHPTVRVGLSFGVVEVQPAESIEVALNRADQALYEAKRQGRGCAVVATGDDHNPVFAESMPLGLMAG